LSYQLILELSEDIGKLKNLRILNLRRNGIPTIPATINLLTRLEFFDFRENPIRELP
jgi:Leucine-rich repeat (LRR) protein